MEDSITHSTAAHSLVGCGNRHLWLIVTYMVIQIQVLIYLSPLFMTNRVLSLVSTASMPIRCVVEQVNGAVSFDSSSTCDVMAVEQDTFAILPISTPLRELVRTALARLGYSSSDALCAKGSEVTFQGKGGICLFVYLSAYLPISFTHTNTHTHSLTHIHTQKWEERSVNAYV